MSRSPMSPAGKRMRTMEDTDDTDDESTIPSNDNNPPSDETVLNRRIILAKESRREISANHDEEDGDDGDEDDDYDDDDDSTSSDSSSVDDTDVEIINEEDSRSSGYEDLLGVVDIPINYEDDEDRYYTENSYGSDEEDDIEHCSPDEYLKHDPTPETQYPKPDWITLSELRARKCGFASTNRLKGRSNMYWFERYASNSLWVIQRLERTAKLRGHSGCVNSLDFNSNGRFLCSGSDDLAVCLWDWQQKTLLKKLTSGHNSNVIQSQFCEADRNIITSSRDGTVRLLDIETNQNELIMSQSGEVGKIAFITPHTLVTCGTNSYVNFIDLRDRRSIQKLFIVRTPKNNRSCQLTAIDIHPIDKHKVVVGGYSPYVFLYDLRRVARNTKEVEHKPVYCIDYFEDTNNMVTSTAFSSTGDKLLVSFNDDDLVVCGTDTCQILHRYRGHRNKKTINGCCWFGDNFVLSGSDDGHIYGWDLESEHIVCFLEGDRGVVNCLCVHPSLPILASSGLDHDVKIWEPHSDTWPQTLKGIKPQICKNTMRRKRAKERESLHRLGEVELIE